MRNLERFEALVRDAHLYTEAQSDGESAVGTHPFDSRNVHPDLPKKVRALFDDGYFAEATFEAFKFIETEIKRIAKVRGASGFALMMDVLNEGNPKIKLNELATDSEIDEQRGFRHMFAGAQSGIRNPRGHDHEMDDTPDQCLDHLSVASVLLRRLDEAGVRESIEADGPDD